MDKFLKKFEQGLTSTLLLVVTFLLFINVVLRTLGLSLDWVEEFARYSIIWMTFIGGSICIYKGAHIGIDSIMGILSKKNQKTLELITIIIALIFTIIFTLKTFNLVSVVFSTGQVSSTIKIPMWAVYGAMPVGGILMIIRYSQELIKKYKSLKEGEK